MSHLFSSSLHYFQGYCVDLMVKSSILSFKVHHHRSEVCSSQIQSKVLSMLWKKTFKKWDKGKEDNKEAVAGRVSDNEFVHCVFHFSFWPVPSGVRYTKEGSILMAEEPLVFSPASSPALILALTSCSCSWLSLKGHSVSSTWNTIEIISDLATLMRKTCCDDTYYIQHRNTHRILTCCLSDASRWATAVTKAAPLLLPLSDRTNLTWHSGSNRRTTLWRRLGYLKCKECKIVIV